MQRYRGNDPRAKREIQQRKQTRTKQERPGRLKWRQTRRHSGTEGRSNGVEGTWGQTHLLSPESLWERREVVGGHPVATDATAGSLGGSFYDEDVRAGEPMLEFSLLPPGARTGPASCPVSTGIEMPRAIQLAGQRCNSSHQWACCLS